MDYAYCREWNDAQWAPIDPISADEARLRFDGGVTESLQWFSVVARRDGVHDDGPVEFVLEVLPHADYVKVKFFEVSHSLGLSFGFTKVEGRLFLDEIVQYTYDDGASYHLESEASVIDASSFVTDGLVHRTVDDTSKPTVLEEDYRGVDVSAHWEPIPEFGQWESLGRFRR